MVQLAAGVLADEPEAAEEDADFDADEAAEPSFADDADSFAAESLRPEFADEDTVLERESVA